MNQFQNNTDKSGVKMDLYRSWHPPLSCSWRWGPVPGPEREHGSACSCQRPQPAAAGLLWGPRQETEQRSEESCRWIPPQPGEREEKERTDETTHMLPNRDAVISFVKLWTSIKLNYTNETFKTSVSFTLRASEPTLLTGEATGIKRQTAGTHSLHVENRRLHIARAKAVNNKGGDAQGDTVLTQGAHY